MVQLYRENYSRTDIEYHYEKWTMLDQIYLFQGRVPFKKITAVAGFAAWMLEVADIRKIVLDDNDPKKHSIVIKKLKEHRKGKYSIKHQLPLKQLKFYYLNLLVVWWQPALLSPSLSLFCCFRDAMLLLINIKEHEKDKNPSNIT